MNLARKTVLAAALAAAALGTGGRAAAEGETGESTPVIQDLKLDALRIKMDCLKLKADVAVMRDKVSNQDTKKDLTQCIADLDRVYSILEHRLDEI